MENKKPSNEMIEQAKSEFKKQVSNYYFFIIDIILQMKHITFIFSFHFISKSIKINNKINKRLKSIMVLKVLIEKSFYQLVKTL